LRKFLIILTLLLIIVVPLLAGCGSSPNKQTIETEQGPVTVEPVNREVQNGDTTTNVGEEKEPTAEDLGIPIYDGAQYVQGSGIPATITQGDKKFEIIAGEFMSSDPLQKITDWYKARLGEPGIANQDEVSWLFRSEDGVTTQQVTLKNEAGQVKITIYKMTQTTS
jgi:hypothetical protein